MAAIPMAVVRIPSVVLGRTTLPGAKQERGSGNDPITGVELSLDCRRLTHLRGNRLGPSKGIAVGSVRSARNRPERGCSVPTMTVGPVPAMADTTSVAAPAGKAGSWEPKIAVVREPRNEVALGVVADVRGFFNENYGHLPVLRH